MQMAKRGVLIKTDTATKIFLLGLALKEHFLIKDIDDTQLFIEENKLEMIKERVQEFKNKYSYEKPAKK